MKIKTRERILIGVLLVVLVGVLTYFIGYRPMDKKNKQTENDIAALQTRYDQLMSLKADEGQYKEDIANMNRTIEEAYAMLPSYVSEEQAIMFAKGIEDNYDMTVSNITLGQVQYVDLSHTGQEGEMCIRDRHRHQKAIVNQREMGLDSVSYAQSLRAALRQDPDVILVGEMRDLETISIAVTAAETGHLVFSTLHTIGAASTIDRIIDVFPPYQQDQIRVQLASVLECVISQQLLPKADGSGRLAAFEVMHANTAIRNLVREGKTHQISSIIQTNRKSGMNTMDDYILDLYNTGKISWENALSFAVDSAMVSRRVGGDIF